MKRAAIVLVLATWPAMVSAGFLDVVRTIERVGGAKRIYIPFMGMARLFVRVVEPEGLSDFRIAVFEGRGRTLPESFDEALSAAVGPRWQTIVKVDSKRDGERVLIFARPAGRRVRMLIVAREYDEGAVIELEVDPRRLSRFIGQARHGHISFNWE